MKENKTFSSILYEPKFWQAKNRMMRFWKKIPCRALQGKIYQYTVNQNKFGNLILSENNSKIIVEGKNKDVESYSSISEIQY